MNENLLMLLKTLLSDEKLAFRFAENKTLDEFFEFCSSVVSGYTKKELDAFLRQLAKLSGCEEYDKITLEELERVSGGNYMKQTNAKILAGAMAIVSLISPLSGLNQNVQADNSFAVEAPSLGARDYIGAAVEGVVEGTFVGIVIGVVIGVAAAIYARTTTPTLSMAPVLLRAPSEKIGLSNLGASCYMNAAIQQLFSIKAIRKYVMEYTGNDGGILALKRIFQLMLDKGIRVAQINSRESVSLKARIFKWFKGIFEWWSGPANVVTKKELRESIKALGYEEETLKNGKTRGIQGDTTEFVTTKLMNSINEKNPLAAFFTSPLKIDGRTEGVMLSEVLKTGGEIDRERMEEIRRDVRAWDNSLPEYGTMDPNSAADKPQREQWARKQTEFLDRPENAYKYNVSVVLKPVQGQVGILLNRTRAIYDQKSLTMQYDKVGTKVTIPDKINIKKSQYELTGVAVHSGERMNGGHYFSYKRERVKDGGGKWWCYNDRDIYEVNYEDIKEDIETNSTILIYSQIIK